MRALGRYVLFEPLGQGSAGAVFRARDTVLDRDIAVKLLHEVHGSDDELRERFFREARACARLRHPNIITLYDFGEIGEQPYMVMELLRGRNLRALMRDSGCSLAVEEKLELMAQVCDALGHAHRAGIIHRDIKPSNIFVEDSVRAKVLDFGIARLASSNLTRPGCALGTPDYMAPEQILGRVCDARSDIFSTGILAFEFLAGFHPFQAPSIPRRIVGGEPESVLDRAPHLPVEAEETLSRALARHPAERYEAAEQMAGALRAVRDMAAQSRASATEYP